jgi:fibronectin type 3 domain-containing protein
MAFFREDTLKGDDMRRMRRLSWFPASLIIMLLFAATAGEARDFIMYRGQPIRFPTPEQLKIPSPLDTSPEGTPLAVPTWTGPLPFATNASPPDAYDLLQWQTSNKDQNPRGSCQSFSFLGALEAFYRRHHGITLDLSEEYFIHGVFTRQHTHNPAVGRDNLSSYCGALNVADGVSGVDGRIQMVKTGMMLPEEKYAPYFGNGNWGLVAYGTNHRHNDMATIAKSHGYQIVSENGIESCDWTYYQDNPWDFTQEMLDNFEYDNRYIPLEARKNAKFGATKIVFLSSQKTQDTALLESIISADQEIDAGFGLGKLDCGNPTYDDGTPVQTLNGATICRYPVVAKSWCEQPGCEGLWEWIDANGKYGESGHELLIVGYDRTRQLFLLKNSWGGTLSYLWVPYQFVEEKSGGGAIVLAVRSPNLDPVPQEMMVGQWDMDHDGHLGSIVVRRPRRPIENVTWNWDYTVFEYESGQLDRIGSYWPAGDDQPKYEVRGVMLDSPASFLQLYVDFSQTEPAPYGKDFVVPSQGQPFSLFPFSGGFAYSHGNFAAGATEWSGNYYGTLLARPDVDLKYTPGSFTLQNWKDNFKLYFSNGERAVLQVTSVGSLQGGSYPVTYKLGNKSGSTSIASGTPHRLTLKEKNVTLNYHTWETGLVSGLGPSLGAFGVRVSDIGVTDVSATDGTYADKIRITWSPHPNAKNYVGAYSVGRSLSADAGTATMVGSTGGTQYDDKTAEPGKIYYYWVSVVGKDGEWTPYSSHDTGFRKISPPTNVAATDGTYSDKVRVTWTPSPGAVLSYSVYRALSQTGLGAVGVLLGTAAGTSFDDTTATPHFTYYYFVVANSAAGSSTPSKSDKGFRVLAPPTGLSATDGTWEDLITVNWTGTTGATHYSILRSGSPRQIAKQIATDANSPFDDTTAVPGATYYYSVKACNHYGCSKSSNVDPGYALLGAPSNVKATKGDFADRVRVTWNAKTGVDSYEVYVGTAQIGAKTLLAKTKLTSYDHMKPKPGIMYYYWVKSKTKYGTSDFGDYDVGYPKIAGPSNVAATLGRSFVRITWNPVANATGYLVSRALSGHGEKQALATSTTTTYDDTTAPFGSGATVYYWVQAIFGSSPPYMTSDYGGPAQVTLPAY